MSWRAMNKRSKPQSHPAPLRLSANQYNPKEQSWSNLRSQSMKDFIQRIRDSIVAWLKAKREKETANFYKSGSAVTLLTTIYSIYPCSLLTIRLFDFSLNSVGHAVTEGAVAQYAAKEAGRPGW